MLHVGKSVLVNFSARSNFSLRQGLSDMPMACAFTVAKSGTYLGVPVGPCTICAELEAAILKYQTRCAYIRSVPGFLQERLRAHQMYAVGVLLFLAQMFELPLELGWHLCLQVCFRRL